MPKYYEEKSWPSLPPEMEAELIKVGIIGEGVMGHKNSLEFSILKCPWSLREWAFNNLPIKIDKKWVVALQKFNISSTPFHVDDFRTCSYNYLLYGEGAKTFWKEEMKGNIVESVEYEKSKWYFHNSCVPHQVANIPNQERIAVTIFKFQNNITGTLHKTGLRFIKAFNENPYFYYT